MEALHYHSHSKTSPPSSSSSDYRPISLLSLISKLLEKHIHFIVTDHLFSHNQISDSPFGFLPNRSTTSALSSACHHILSFLDKATPVCGVFLDVRKAFHSVTHSKLLKKLHSLGLHFHLINWLQCYLCSHSQSVRIGNSISSSLPVSSGVLQGSILGPILFLIFINEVGVLSLSPRARLFLFADDILILHPLSSSSCCGALQEDLNLITSWLTHNSSSVNPSKSKYMIFSFKSQAAFDYLPPLLLNHVSLERVYSFKYLGLQFSPSMSWSNHISQVIKKAKRLLGLIYRHFYKSSSRTLLSLYVTLVRPILEYASVIWDPSSPSVSSSLEAVQHFALKLASKSWSSSYSSLLSFFNISSLSHRRARSKVIHIFKLKQGYSFCSVPLSCKLTHPNCSIRSYSAHDFQIPFCRTASFFNSFLPSSLRLWNSLPISVKSSTSLSFIKFTIDRTSTC